MNDWIRYTITLALTVALGGCAGVGTFQSSIAERVDRLVAQEAYGDALRLLDYVNTAHPDHAALMERRQQIREKAEAHAAKVARQAVRLADQGRWGDALALYHEAARHLPPDTQLQASLDRLLQRQTDQVRGLEARQLILEAEWLAEALPLQTAITRVAAGDVRQEQELVRLTRAAEAAAQRLTRMGLEALEAGDHTIARRTLRLASRLAISPEADQALRQLPTREPARSTRGSAPAQESRRQENRQAELAALEAALQGDELLRAKGHAETLVALATDDPRFHALREELERRVSEVINRELALGNSLYSRGSYQEAIVHWEQVLALDPGHEQARGRVERAQRVIETLQRLRERQTPSAAPSP